MRLSPDVELAHDEVLRQIVIPDEVLRQVALLASPDWPTREKATRTLYEMTVADEILLATLIDPDLGIEQRSRLIASIAQRITFAPRGAVGIRMRRNMGGEPGVVVEAVIPGMPGEKFLKPGDRIKSIDGLRINTSTDLTSVVQGRLPGDNLVFEVVRKVLDERGINKLDAQGAAVTASVIVEFPLGSVAQLDKSGGVSSSSRVLTSRARLVDTIRTRFGPRLQKIRTNEVVQADQAYMNRAPETHPSVAWLLQQLELIESRGGDVNIKVRTEINRRMSNLILEAQGERKSDSERKWLSRVVNRYRELMPTD
ncbi:MAG: PDZ domain-containing protein [Phycisphaerales bacterium]|nr:PDZ domain-containing protein [Phycisphaerales bacterium]